VAHGNDRRQALRLRDRPGEVRTMRDSCCKALCSVCLAVLVALAVGCAGGGGSAPSPPPAAISVSLTITITGLPTGVNASVSVTGPAGFSASLTSTQTLTVTPGTYTIAASGVRVGNSTYFAFVLSQTVNVAVGLLATASVDYVTIVPDTTKVLDQTGLQTLSVSADHSTLSISASSSVAQSLSVGDVLVVPASTPAPDGLLRKITAVSKSGSQIILTTVQGTMTEAMPSAHIHFTQALGPQNVRAMRAMAAGVKITQRAVAALETSSGTVSNLCAGNPITLVEMGDVEIAPHFNATGEIDICSSFKVDGDFSWFNLRATSLTAQVTFSEFSHVGVTGSYTLGSFKVEKEIAKVEFSPIEILVGGVPIELVPVITFSVGANGDVSVGFSAGISQNGSITGGFRYEGAPPLIPIFNQTLSLAPDPLAIDAGLQAKGFVTAEVDLLLYGIVGPFFKPDAYVQLSVDIFQNPWWTLTAGIEGPVGIKATIFGFVNLVDSELGTLFDKVLFTKTAVPGGFLSVAAAPLLSSVTPNQVMAGAPALQLALKGSNFVPGAVASFNGNAISTSFVDTQDLAALVPSADLTTQGLFQIAITNPDPNPNTHTLPTSNSLSFTVLASGTNPAPTIKSLSPASVVAGSGATALKITGTGFLPASTVSFGGSPLSSTLVSNTQLNATLGASVLTAPGTFPVTVTNPPPGGGTSNAASFTVVTGGAVTVTLSPQTAIVPVAGSQTLSAAVTGTTNTSISWAVQEGQTGGTVTSTGTSTAAYIAPQTTGTFHVIATSQADSSATAVATITVVPSSFVLLHSFSGADGADPEAGLVQATDGNFYGTTAAGGTASSGTVFRMNGAGSFALLHSFVETFPGLDGTIARANLIQAIDGNFYGTTSSGGQFGNNGTVFKMDTSGTVTVLHSFNGQDGSGPLAGLIQAKDGMFYGTTGQGGLSGAGTVFRMDASGNVAVLHSFSEFSIGSPDGFLPLAGLTQANDGNFYGTTFFGGQCGQGVVFKMDAGGQITVLHDFCGGTDGGNPAGGLVQASDGFLYGTTTAGGLNGGVVFKTDTAGSFTVLHAFTGPEGFGPSGSLIQGNDGFLYGTTKQGGTFLGAIFRTDISGNVTGLHSFNLSDGYLPNGGLILATDGNFYGTTQAGGASSQGVVFRIASPKSN
jgi:uncharacterized repeat protein (TIGR03803 family)